MANSLFLDTNVYLSFYHLTNEDLDELNKLLVLTNSKEITLYIPEQTMNEFSRNRDVKIADAIKRFNENKLNNIYPQITKDYIEEYGLMREAAKTFEKAKQSILDKIKTDILNNDLKADKIIEKLFKIGTKIPTTTDLVARSQIRYDLGNPPGKNNSYGDALNWESLLSTVGEFENFFFLSDDKDYFSVFDDHYFNSFLLKEWESKMVFTPFRYYKSLSTFFKENYPNINISTELKKEQLITGLSESSSFSETRNILRELVHYNDFTNKQLADIVQSSVSNNQIYWIGKDNDISNFLNDIVGKKFSIVDPEIANDFKRKFPKYVDIDDNFELSF
jgi:predicted nucleic acid-binding protein